jgi:lipopolysaccharide transport system permease protein
LEKTVVYEPNSRRKIGFFKVWILMIRNIIASRELIFQLFKRDFLMSYKKSFIGAGWIFITPIIGVLSWIFMNHTGVLRPGNVGIPYPAYVLLGTSIWGLFMGFYSSAAGTLGAGASFIMQVKYPHEVLLIKQTAQQLANFLFAFIINIFVLLFFGVSPSWMIILFPILILPIFLLGAGIGLMIAVFNAMTPDLQKGFDFVLGLVLYITPVIYSSKVSNPFLQKIITWNPLTYLIGVVRDSIIYGRIEYFDRFILASIFSLLFFLISWRLFFISEEKVIEKMV